jgi:glycosyltransferase involved in cell wall biosynthesis
MGRLVPEKRVDWLIESFIRMTENNQHIPPVKLVIAGGSSATDAYTERLQTASADRDDIIFTGYVTGDEKEELLSNALVLALPSYLEGFPIVLLEAKSYGICCLASDISPHKEAIRSGIDGMLFSSHSHADLTEKLQSLLVDLDSAERLGKRAREEMQKRPSWAEIVQRTVDLYQEAVKV